MTFNFRQFKGPYHLNKGHENCCALEKCQKIAAVVITIYFLYEFFAVSVVVCESLNFKLIYCGNYPQLLF